MESDRYLLSKVSRSNERVENYTLVSNDKKLARQIAQVARSKNFLCTVDLVDPMLYLCGMSPDLPKNSKLLLDEGSIHFTDTNYFLDGYFRENGSKLEGFPIKYYTFPTMKKYTLQDGIHYYRAVPQ